MNMDSIGQPERATQNRIIASIRNELKYRYLGDWSDRATSNIEEGLLSAWLATSGYSPAQISVALHKLRTETENHNRTLYGNNQAVYNLLRHAPGLADQINHRQTTIVTHALKHPGHGYTVESHRRSHRVTLQTARTDLLALTKLKLLEAGKRGCALVFYAPEGLRTHIELGCAQAWTPAARSRQMNADSVTSNRYSGIN